MSRIAESLQLCAMDVNWEIRDSYMELIGSLATKQGIIYFIQVYPLVYEVAMDTNYNSGHFSSDYNTYCLGAYHTNSQLPCKASCLLRNLLTV